MAACGSLPGLQRCFSGPGSIRADRHDRQSVAGPTSMREPCLPIELRCRAPQQDGRLRAKFGNLTNVIESVFACAQLPRERETARVSLHPNYLAGAAAFMTVAIAGPIKAQGLDGFEGARWGMSMQQVQSAFSGRLVPFTPPGDDASPKFGFPRYDAEGCNFDVDFKFENERLVRVDLVLISDSMEAAECPTKMAASLTAKYGVPVVDEPSTEMYSQNHKRVWIEGVTKISEFSFFFPSLTRTILNITYTPAQISG
jgi:hypothetical protein